MTLAIVALVLSIASVGVSMCHLYWLLRLRRALAEGERIAAANNRYVVNIAPGTTSELVDQAYTRTQRAADLRHLQYTGR